MFYNGSLQSGIASAIQERKLVACFVRKDDDECSLKWEDEWLKSSDGGNEKQLGDRLAEKAIFLRIDAGTQEAGFLGAFCSLDSIPKLLIIRQGSVLENIDANVSQDDFRTRIVSQLEHPHEQRQEQQTHMVAGSSDSANRDASQVLSNVPFIGERQTSLQDSTTPIQETAETNVPIPAPTASSNTPNMQQFLSERGARLEAERKRQEEAAKEARKATAEARKEAADKEMAASSSAPQRNQDWMEQQRIRQQESRLERERVLKTIESDKKARKEREEQRRQLASGEPATAAAHAPVQTDPSTGLAGPVSSLNIRLFDGTSLRTKFDSSASLATAVRTYIKEQAPTDIPYEFRQILTPHPSRNIAVGEEDKSLQSIGLVPSATLVLVPVKGYTDAYASGGGLVSKGFNAGYGILSGAASMLGSAVGGVIGYGSTGSQGPYMSGTSDEREASNTQGNRMAHGSSGGINIRTLGDQRREAGENTELYNGNQLNFEPRKKKDDQGGAKDD